MPLEDLIARTLGHLQRDDDRAPLHIQLEDVLRRLIRSGQVSAGSVLPGEFELAASLGLSRHTVRHALSTLAAEGLLRRERGRGTHVTDPTTHLNLNVRSLDHFYAFAWEAAALGLEQRSHVLEFKQVSAPPVVVRQLSLGDERDVVRIIRVRSAGGEPLVMEVAYIPVALAAGLDPQRLEYASIYDEIERLYGLRVSHARETIRPTILSQRLANHLATRKGRPAFLVERLSFSDVCPIEWQESTVRGDRFLYSVDLNRR